MCGVSRAVDVRYNTEPHGSFDQPLKCGERAAADGVSAANSSKVGEATLSPAKR